jgi:hypothetical protein
MQDVILNAVKDLVCEFLMALQRSIDEAEVSSTFDK